MRSSRQLVVIYHTLQACALTQPTRLRASGRSTTNAYISSVAALLKHSHYEAGGDGGRRREQGSQEHEPYRAAVAVFRLHDDRIRAAAPSCVAIRGIQFPGPALHLFSLKVSLQAHLDYFVPRYPHLAAVRALQQQQYTLYKSTQLSPRDIIA